MRFAALGDRKNPAVLFFHAMGVMGESSELVANICRKDIFAFCKLKPTLVKAGMCHIQDESKEEIAYAQDMFETIFKDYALKTYNKDVGEKAAEYVAQGVTYDQYYAAYFAARGITGDKDENGKTITNSASRKKKEAIDKAVPGASTKQKHLLYEALGVSEKVW